jgi:hypothetical protein
VRVAERATPVAAVIAALTSLACCLPFSFVGAFGLLGASARLQVIRPWLLTGSAVFLIIGFVQLYVRRNQCQKRSRLSVVIFWIATGVVLLLIVFPQIVASLLAG